MIENITKDSVQLKAGQTFFYKHSDLMFVALSSTKEDDDFLWIAPFIHRDIATDLDVVVTMKYGQDFEAMLIVSLHNMIGSRARYIEEIRGVVTPKSMERLYTLHNWFWSEVPDDIDTSWIAGNPITDKNDPRIPKIRHLIEKLNEATDFFHQELQYLL